ALPRRLRCAAPQSAGAPYANRFRAPPPPNLLTRFGARAVPVDVTRAASYASLGCEYRASAMRDTWPRLKQIAFPPIQRGRLDTLQVNIGYRCNQSCVLTHVSAGPDRSAEMPGERI